jgi:hypothetical protein
MPMSYHDPDGWPAPPRRAPQHAAAPFSVSSPLRQQAHRALRLFVTAGTWAAGLCLVIGLLVLVASAARPGRIGHFSTASSAQSATRRHRGAPATGGSAADRPGRAWSGTGRQDAGGDAGASGQDRQIAEFTGHGDQTTRQFTLDNTTRWQLEWSYSCPAGQASGLLIVEDTNGTAVAQSIDQSGLAGHGDTWLHPDGASHHLLVFSTCSWTMKVVQ